MVSFLSIIIILAVVLYTVSFSYNQLHSKHLEVEREVEELQVLLNQTRQELNKTKESLNRFEEAYSHEESVLTREYVVNDSIYHTFQGVEEHFNVLHVYMIYCLFDNTTIEIELNYTKFIQEEITLGLVIACRLNETSDWIGISNETANGRSYVGPLPTHGWFFVTVGGPHPAFIDRMENWSTSFTLQIKLKYLDQYVPFFAYEEENVGPIY
jgi:hypothetical protein